MTDKERELALYCLKASSDYHSEVCEECIKYPNCDHTIQDDVTETIIEALEQEPCGETVSLEAFKQVKWERDIAIEQLKELGYGFGQKIEPSGDLIRRQSVLNACEQSINILEAVDRIMDLPSVKPQVSCEDAISRQAVDTLVDELARAISDERCCMSRGRSTATIMQDILDLPPVNPQPRTGHWIPVSERLPEKGQRVLASQTIEYGHRVEITQYDRFGFLLGIVDAWMPLPEPYEPQESEDQE